MSQSGSLARKRKVIQLKRKKLALLEDNMIMYTENSKKSIKQLLELIKIQGHKTENQCTKNSYSCISYQ